LSLLVLGCIEAWNQNSAGNEMRDVRLEVFYWFVGPGRRGLDLPILISWGSNCDGLELNHSILSQPAIAPSFPLTSLIHSSWGKQLGTWGKGYFLEIDRHSDSLLAVFGLLQALTRVLSPPISTSR
jgi:hypothetical protein